MNDTLSVFLDGLNEKFNFSDVNRIADFVGANTWDEKITAH